MVYDQTVVRHLSNEIEISLFDPTLISIENEMISDIVEASIHVLAKSGVRCAPNESVGVYPPTDFTGKWSYDFIGDVSGIDLNSNAIALDIGVGEVIVELTDEIEQMILSNEISLKTRLHIQSQRTDIEL